MNCGTNDVDTEYMRTVAHAARTHSFSYPRIRVLSLLFFSILLYSILSPILLCAAQELAHPCGTCERLP